MKGDDEERDDKDLVFHSPPSDENFARPFRLASGLQLQSALSCSCQVTDAKVLTAGLFIAVSVVVERRRLADRKVK